MMSDSQKLVRIHVTQRPKGIVRPASEVRFFDTAEQLTSQIDGIGTEESCCFNTKDVESVEVFTG